MSYSPEQRQELLAALVEAISNGGTLRQFARDNEVSYRTLYDWINSSDLWTSRIARARDVGADAIADEVLDILDDAPSTSEGVAKAKAQAWGRLQLLAKWRPAKYGDRQHLTHANDKEQPITIITGVPQPKRAADDEVDLSMFE